VIDVEPLIRTELESLMPLPDGAPQDWEDVLARSGLRNRRSRRRLLLAVAACVVVAAASGAGIAAALGAFSGGVTIAQVRACDPSTVALTTPSGAQVLTGHTEEGIYCLAYRDPNGAGGGTGGRIGDSPVGEALAEKVLDTASHTYVIAGVVPAGYTKLTVGSTAIPIVNQAFVIDPKLVVGPGTLSGPAGQTTINLSELAGGP
jgi:hypothetical protein